MTTAAPDIPAVEAAIVEMTNQFREANRLEDVRTSAMLAAAARAYARYLARSGAFSHTADGREAGDRVAAAGYEWCLVGENLAANADSRGFASRELARKNVEGWMNSPGHRANMLAPLMTEIGVGVARVDGALPKFISVQLFARPRSLMLEFQVSNTTKAPITLQFGGESHDISVGSSLQLSTCTPGDLAFERKSGGKSIPVAGRFTAQTGTAYVVKPDGQNGVRVEVEPLQRLP